MVGVSKFIVGAAALFAGSDARMMTQMQSHASANPIRKVVTMLQKIQQKVEAEGEAETELHEKFMCECKTGTAEYTQSISDGGAKVESLAAGLESSKGELTQLKSDLTNHKADREAAKAALSEATEMRANEAKAFAGVKAEAETNIKAMGKAVAAIEKGAGGAFLQTDAAQVLRNLASSNDQIPEQIISFLSSEDGSAGSGEITGVLKQLGDEMAADLASATKDEEKAIANFNELTAAKNEEVATLTAAIEDKITRVGEAGLAIADIKADAKDTAEKLVEDKQFLSDLKADCAKKEEEWDAVCKERKGELLALAETIEMLNSDEALELFKKTLPSAASSFMQVTATSQEVMKRALATIRAAQKSGRKTMKLDLVALALHGKTANFDKVLGLIDEMVSVLKTEQTDDDDKKEYCNSEIDQAEDKLKAHMQTIKDTETAIADAKETISTLENEIMMLQGSIALLDKSVSEATAQRKSENAAFKELRSGNVAAKQLIEMAKKRLNKFYNPTIAFLQATSSTLVQKKSAESGGVIAMMDTLAADLEKETTVATANEKDAQADYEKYMADSKTMRADNSKLIEDKGAAKADAIGALEGHQDNLEAAFTKMKGANDQLKVLHADCDWLLANYDARKEARADEIDALGKAKAVLSGAGFVQE
jgi:chromosome segregation ATPase